MSLAVSIYELTARFPKDEQFGLTSQARRASVSIAANIAEGYGRATRASYVNFLRISQGSLKELETHLILADRLGFVPPDDVSPLLNEADEIGRMLRALIVRLSGKSAG